MKIILFGLFFLLLSNNLLAGPKEYYYQKTQRDKAKQSLLLANNDSDNVVEYRFQQLIDHTNPKLGTFSQRYYIDESYSISNDSPVFFYIGGEIACTKESLNLSIRDFAKKHHAKMVALEHRYYGKSSPFSTLSTKNLKYLTTEFALLDLKRFQENIIATRNWHGKWISFGGSYPGALSAYYRAQYPDLVAGSLASSAPVQARENFDRYDAHIADTVEPTCLANIQAVAKQVENALDNEVELFKIKAKFDGTAINHPLDFLYLVADVAAYAVQFGDSESFCYQLATADTPLDGYAQFAKKLFHKWGVDALSFSAQGAMNEDSRVYENVLGMRGWYYQSCTEYGYWQNAYPDPARTARSSLINLDYHKNLCKRLFDIEYNLDTDKINNKYYLPLFNVNVSNIYFTNGSTDPWSHLSMSDQLGGKINPNLDFYMIDSASHCDDLRAARYDDSASVQYARQKLNMLISKWLE